MSSTAGARTTRAQIQRGHERGRGNRTETFVTPINQPAGDVQQTSGGGGRGRGRGRGRELHYLTAHHSHSSTSPLSASGTRLGTGTHQRGQQTSTANSFRHMRGGRRLAPPVAAKPKDRESMRAKMAEAAESRIKEKEGTIQEENKNSKGES
ncbi:hypothetical protein SpCBS45565_g07041 [Spizellomyces sp. 'palustris']|nr:hypothetical protein SpCBS45565_g07041 [Spizellomyces sp. 'palustris']